MQSLFPAVVVLCVFVAGAFIGYAIKAHVFWVKLMGRATAWLVYLLLCLLGHSVGRNPQVVSNLDTIGVQAFAIALGAIAGSLLCVTFYGRLLLPQLSNSANRSASGADSLLKRLWGSGVLLLFFAIGALAGRLGIDGNLIESYPFTDITLYLLMCLVGVSVGCDASAWAVLKKGKLLLLGIPGTIAVGSLIGAVTVSLVGHEIRPNEALSVGAGMGYYSLSSLFITELAGEKLGTIALLSNVFREVVSLIATPLLCRIFGPLAGVATAGATAMDTSLPVIMRTSGPEIGTIAVLSGFVLTALVPVLVPLMYLL